MTFTSIPRPLAHEIVADVMQRAKGQQETHAPQQNQGGCELAGQACSSSSSAFASFRSSVSKPSVNQP